jgi:hypothetical protein
MENLLHSQKVEFQHMLKTFRSLNKDVTQSAKDGYAVWKEEILHSSSLELSGLESKQEYSAAMVASFDRLSTVNLRRNWSEHIKYGFYFMVWVQVLIIPVLLTLMFLHPEVTFDKITPIIYVVVAQNFLQIVGLVLVVVKYLFPPEMPNARDS